MSIIKFWKALFCFAWMPLYIGGPKVSNQGGATTNTTNNTTTNTDNTKITNTSTTFDNHAVDVSNRSMNWDLSSKVDSSVRNTTSNSGNTSIVTDGGAFDVVKSVGNNLVSSVSDIGNKLIAGTNASQVHAYDYADNIFHSAVDFANKNDDRALGAFDRAATITGDALSSARQAYSGAAAQLQTAYADAKGTTASQEKIMLGVLAVAGVAVVAVMARKG